MNRIILPTRKVDMEGGGQEVQSPPSPEGFLGLNYLGNMAKLVKLPSLLPSGRKWPSFPPPPSLSGTYLRACHPPPSVSTTTKTKTNVSVSVETVFTECEKIEKYT